MEMILDEELPRSRLAILLNNQLVARFMLISSAFPSAVRASQGNLKTSDGRAWQAKCGDLERKGGIAVNE
jgi:hypothetical protein